MRAIIRLREIKEKSMKNKKLMIAALAAASMLIAGCDSSSSSAISGASNSSSSGSVESKPTMAFAASSFANATKITNDDSGYYSTDGVNVTGVNCTNVYGTGESYIKIGIRSTAGAITFTLDGSKAITSVKMNAAMVNDGTQTVTFADSANPDGVSATVTGIEFADYAFPSLSNPTGSVVEFTVSVPKAAPIYLASLTFGLQDGEETKADSMSVASGDITELPMGETSQIEMTILPSGVTYPDCAYASADEGIATVDGDGTVTGVKKGNTVVTVTLPGAHSASGNDIVSNVNVEVIDPIASLLTSTKDGSTYGDIPSTDYADGTNYAATATSINQHQLSAAQEFYDLPSTGTKNILVIPVCFAGDEENAANEATRGNLYKTFFGDPEETGWESLASFYYKSSFGQLLLHGTISEWWQCGYTARTVANWTSTEFKSYDPTWRLLEEAVAWYKVRYRTTCEEFDLDQDGALDGVWMVYSQPFDSTGANKLLWAYTFEDLSASGEEVAFKYAWASYKFMYEGYGPSKVDAHTYIHETGHMMGLDDYYAYNTASNFDPMGKIDMMDNNIIDHNAYSKFAYGWIKPYVVSGACEITLKPAETSGQAILLPDENGWNGSAFDEYILMEFYTPTGLNEKDSQVGGYPGNNVRGFSECGVRIYHVDARMIYSTYNGSGWGAWGYTDEIKHVHVDESPFKGTQYTVLAHSNSSDRQMMTDGIEKDFRLLQMMDCTRKRDFNLGVGSAVTADNSSLFQDGDSFSLSDYHDSFAQYYYKASASVPAQKKELMNDGSALGYTASFSAMSDDSITVTISK
jgi:M6 family metalloprotease-like protein